MHSSEPLPTSKKILIALILFLLVFWSFVQRLDNFRHSRTYSIDEVVYFRLGDQLKNDFPSYNTIEYGHELARTGRDLPDYFFKPLYKYPPGYAGLIAASFSIFGESKDAGIYPSIALGVLTILLVFLLGELLFGWQIGLCAALFFAMDPVSIICSQKMWPDTSLAFFTTLAIYLFLVAQKTSRNFLYVLSGLATAMATWIKFPGALTIPVIIGIILISQNPKDMFKKPVLQALIIPFLFLIPWIVWNLIIYHGSINFFTPQAHGSPMRFQRVFLAAGMVTAAAIIIKLFSKPNTVQEISNTRFNLFSIANLVIFAAFVYAMFPHILKSFSLNQLPLNSWAQGVLPNKSTFYFGQLIEFSLLYLVAFTGVILHPKQNKNATIVILASAIFLIFYVLWGNNQSRYITSAIPFLAILTVLQIKNIIHALSEFQNSYIKFTLILLLGFLIAHAIHKTAIINALVSFPNDLCYF